MGLDCGFLFRGPYYDFLIKVLKRVGSLGSSIVRRLLAQRVDLPASGIGALLGV